MISDKILSGEIKSLLGTCRRLGIDINSITVGSEPAEIDEVEFTTQELLEKQGEQQTYLDLEAERLGRSLIFHSNDEIGV